MIRAPEFLILLVDDDEQLRDLLQCLLQAEGYKVVSAGDGEQALDVSRRLRDRLLLITDINMSRMNGIELSNSIRQERPGTPVLFISGDPENARETSLQPQLLLKPFKPDDFLMRVRSAASEGTVP